MPGPGALVYVMGASGAGKDSVLAYARQRAAGLPLAFAHRYITREAGAGGENHVALSGEEFALRRERGLFALCWEANGHAYAVGREIEAWMAAGLTVAANGSRAALGQARRAYPDLVPVLVRADPEVLERRLARRGREDGAERRARLLRAVAMEPCAADLCVIGNDGPLEEAGEAFLNLLRGLCPGRPAARAAQARR